MPKTQWKALDISTLPQKMVREPIPERSSGDSSRARYCTAQPEEVCTSTPAQASPRSGFRFPQ